MHLLKNTSTFSCGPPNALFQLPLKKNSQREGRNKTQVERMILNFKRMDLTNPLVPNLGTITEKSSVTFSLGGDNLKRYFDQR